MKLGVYSLKNTCYQGEVKSITCRTSAGEITVLDHHRPLLSVLALGVIKITDTDRREHYVPVASGFLEVMQTNESRCIIDQI